VRTRLGAAGLVLAVLLVMAVRLVGQARDDSLIYDERAYVFSGRCLLDSGRDLDPRQPVGFRVLAGLGTKLYSAPAVSCGSLADAEPWFASQGGGLRDLIASSRLPSVALAVLLVLVVVAWAWAAYGPAGGAVAAAVTGFEPTLLAHDHLATPDALLTLGVVGCLAAHWAWERSGRRGWLAASALGLAAGMLAKVIALEILPVLVMASVLPAVLGRRRGPAGRGPDAIRRVAVRALAVAAVVGAGAWLGLCLAYLPLLPPAASPLAVVAPPQWLHSLTYQLAQAATGTTNYLNGRVFRGADPAYFIEALGLKTTLPLLLLAGLAVARARRGVPPAAWHLVSAAVVIVAVPSLGGIDIGVRYVLALYPLMAMAAASLAWRTGRSRHSAVTAAALLLLLLLTESLAHGGNSIGYFNQLAGSRPERYLADSNLDWGQDAWRLRDWWQAHGSPDLTTAYFGGLQLGDYGIRAHALAPGEAPGDGEIAVSLTRLVVYGSPGDGLGTLRRCPDPGARVGVSIQLARGLQPGGCAAR
jgi:hypothetical protein